MRLGCRWGMPHDYKPIHETKSYKIEKCTLCGKRIRWNYGLRGRVKNTYYLTEHVRNFAQRNGSTRRVYNKLYKPEKCIIYL